MDIFNPYYLQIIMFMIVNAIMGISIYITLATGQLSLGAAGFMSVGAYVAALLTLKLSLPISLAILIGGLCAMLVAFIIGLPTTRLQGLYLAIATLGFGEVVRVIFLNLDITNGALGLSGIPSIAQEITVFFYEIGLDSIGDLDAQTLGNIGLVLILLILLSLLIFFCVRINHSRIGRAFAAIKADAHAAELMGINVVYYKMAAFMIGAFVAGVGGGLYAHITFFINPTDFSYHKVVQILLYPVFGGSNVVWGSLLGSFVLTLLPEVLRFMADYRDVIYGILLVVLMAVRPDGLITEQVVERIGRRFGWIQEYKPTAEKQVLTERFQRMRAEHLDQPKDNSR
ncbi:branched-chain amino acid ABC transporter permease [Veillonella sp. R32]|uniref:branched-chain amino acid ABC transporter permease n=1 Tax=Veillonella sp. R32 TaxID=2021312 RepID=UPI001389EB39|nr:branched-chain amino acid ABC transporter permease [Veillonella sp. R32]KAF1679303.1 branched-chain amino acid ABC transporter permease [Veillonella sp. R32]